MAVSGDRGRERLLVDAFDRRLAGGIDIGDDHAVGVVEAGGEGVEQRGQARVAMRLDDGDHLALGRGARRFQHRRDFDRMVAVVVVDGDAVPFPVRVKRRLTPPKLAIALRMTSIGAPSSCATVIAAVALSALCRPGIGSARSSMKVARPVARSRIRTENRVTPAGEVDVEKAHVGLRILAVGQHAAVLDPPDQLLHRRMVEAHDGEAVEREVLDQGEKGLLDGVEGLEVVEVLGIDIGDDGDVGGQLEERAVAFVGLDHHPVAGAEPRVGSVGVDDAAVDDRRVEAGGVEQRRHQRGRRGLAMRAGDGHALLEPHQLGEHFGPPHYGNAPRARRDDLGIVALDGGRNDDDRGLRRDWPCRGRRRPSRPCSRRRLTLALSLRSEPWTLWPRLMSTSAMPDMPMPPMPTKWMGPIWLGSFMLVESPSGRPTR